MAWTAPRTWVAAEIFTAANMNTHVRDNMKAVAGADKAACRVTAAAAQSIPNTTATVVTFSSEYFDTQTIHDLVTNTGRMTIPTGWGGQWMFGAGIGWATSTGTSYRTAAIQLNGTLTIASDRRAPTGDFPGHNLSTLYAVVAGDYAEVVVSQDSGGALNTGVASAHYPVFWCEWRGTG